jgi:signal transduction histidine kinase
MRDITEEKKLEVERAALLAAERETAHRLQELAALRADFSRMVAHELGSPIAAVRRAAELLATDPLTATQEWALAVIQKEADSLRSLVDDVVAIATIEQDDFTVQLQPVRVEALLINAAEFGRSLSGSGPVTIAESTDDEVLADPDRIGQVLRNLVNNSLRYSPLGTAITLRATQRQKRVRIEVADRGPGINLEDQERIFEKFARGRDRETLSIPGGGLGLYLSRRIVQAHGSDLTVASSPGQGATFGFELEVAP